MFGSAWARCDGTKFDESQSPFKGSVTPNLMQTDGDDGYYLRPGTYSKIMTFYEETIAQHA